jgi:hypothetical protein
MANTVVKGNYQTYSGVDRFTNRVVDEMDGSNLSPIDNMLSGVKKEYIWKNKDVVSSVTVDFLNVDNGWHFGNEDNRTIQSISKINK